jgi:hypothetical protein
MVDFTCVLNLLQANAHGEKQLATMTPRRSRHAHMLATRGRGAKDTGVMTVAIRVVQSR